jgi:hypothetical protein
MLHEYGHEHSCFKKENLLPLEVGNSPILRGIISLEREKKINNNYGYYANSAVLFGGV